MYKLDKHRRLTIPSDLLRYCNINLAHPLGIFFTKDYEFFLKNEKFARRQDQLVAIVKADEKARIYLPLNVITALGATASSSFVLYVRDSNLYLDKWKKSASE